MHQTLVLYTAMAAILDLITLIPPLEIYFQFAFSAFLVNIEDSQLGDIMKYYQTGAHAPISHHLRQITETSGGREIWDIVDSYRMNLPESQDAIWMVGV